MTGILHSLFSSPYTLHLVLVFCCCFFLSLEFTFIRSQSFKRQQTVCSICIRHLCMALQLGFKRSDTPLTTAVLVFLL